jgi:hypothetical protein
MSTGIAQTQIVNRPATMGVGNNIPPVSASPAASRAVRAQAAGNPASALGGRTRLPGPPGSAVASVELLPNVTKGAASVKVMAPPLPTFTMDELLLLAHLVDTYAGDPETSEANRELAERARGTIAALTAAIG